MWLGGRGGLGTAFGLLLAAVVLPVWLALWRVAVWLVQLTLLLFIGWFAWGWFGGLHLHDALGFLWRGG